MFFSSSYSAPQTPLFSPRQQHQQQRRKLTPETEARPRLLSEEGASIRDISSPTNVVKASPEELKAKLRLGKKWFSRWIARVFNK